MVSFVSSTKKVFKTNVRKIEMEKTKFSQKRSNEHTYDENLPVKKYILSPLNSISFISVLALKKFAHKKHQSPFKFVRNVFNC